MKNDQLEVILESTLIGLLAALVFGLVILEECRPGWLGLSDSKPDAPSENAFASYDYQGDYHGTNTFLICTSFWIRFKKEK